MYHVIPTGGIRGIWSPSSGAPSIASSVHRHVEDWWGCTSAEPNHSRDIDKGGTQSPFQYIRDEDNPTGFEWL